MVSVRHLEQTNRDLRLDGVRILSPAEQTDGSAQVGLPWSRRPAGTVPAKRRSLGPRGFYINLNYCGSLFDKHLKQTCPNICGNNRL